MLAIDRLKRLFDAEHVNVQPHSGAQANMAVFMAALAPGDTVLGMSLAHGGHLTHGTKVSFSGKLLQRDRVWRQSAKPSRIDFGEVRALAREHRPKLIVARREARTRARWNTRRFASVADQGRRIC